MPNFANGKIYAIRSHQTEQIYVGSTTQPLSVRFGGHKRQTCSSREIMKFEDCYIELLENYPCADKNELNRREGELIRNMDCVNKQIPGRTVVEWHQDNKQAIKEQRHYYYQDNIEIFKEQKKQYREDNKETINEKAKQYRIDNIQTIKAKQNQKHNCCCGGRYTNSGKSQHFKTDKHRDFVSEFLNRLHTLLSA
jgi:hypothetical protein